MYPNRQVAHHFGKEIQYSMTQLYDYFFQCFLYNNYFNIKITTMLTQTPMKLLENNIEPNKLGLTMRKQPTSHELTRQFLEQRLAAKQKKLQACQQKVKQQAERIEGLQKTIKEKDKEIHNKNETIGSMKKRISNLEQEVAKILGNLHQKNKSITKKEMESIKQKQQQNNHDKLNKVLTKQNSELIGERVQYKRTIEELTERLCQKQEQINIQINNSTLLTKLNQDLKFQIQELLFQIRMMNRRQQTNKLIQYEEQISYRGLSQISGQTSQLAQSSDKQLLELLKLKIGSLEQQLQVSERRCKQLQTIVLSQ